MSRMSSWIWKARPTCAPNSTERLEAPRVEVWRAVGGHEDRGAYERPGLQCVHLLDFAQRQQASLCCKVECLSARHAGRAAGVGKCLDDAHPNGTVVRQAGMTREQLECEDLQRIAGQDRGRLVVGLVARGPAAAQVVVVHCRKVVVHQRVGVNQFDRAGRCVHGLEWQAKGLGRRIRQGGPDPLARAEHAVALRRVQPLRDRGLGRKPALEVSLDAMPPFVEACVQCGIHLQDRLGVPRVTRPVRRTPARRPGSSAAGSRPSARPA